MITTQTITQVDEALYLAFRAAFVSTFERMENENSIAGHCDRLGFLEVLPVAEGCASHVQIDVLLETWRRLAEREELRPIDQCVCYCATDELAKVAKVENQRILAQVANGPRKQDAIDLVWLSSKLRTMQITWPYEFDHLRALRDEDVLWNNLDQCSNLQNSLVSELLEIVGRWLVQPGLLASATGLLTQAEQEYVGCFFQQRPELMNL